MYEYSVFDKSWALPRQVLQQSDTVLRTTNCRLRTAAKYRVQSPNMLLRCRNLKQLSQVQ